RNTGDFKLHKTTDFLAGDHRRVWFVDAGTRQLCSINLDGTDRRTELETPLRRCGTMSGRISLYALIPNEETVLYVGKDDRWHAVQSGADRKLQTDFSEGYTTRGNIKLCSALGEIGRPPPADPGHDGIDGVYYSGSTYPLSQRDARGTLSVQCDTYWVDGSGSGLQVRGPRKLDFRIPAGVASLACRNPVIIDERTILFDCGNAIAVMDLAARKVGLLAHGDSFVMCIPSFQKPLYGWEPPPSRQQPGRPRRDPRGD
ncbi:MAG: hypothetical protein P8Y53_24855, partial [Pseudolabrys sp.]